MEFKGSRKHAAKNAKVRTLMLEQRAGLRKSGLSALRSGSMSYDISTRLKAILCRRSLFHYLAKQHERFAAEILSFTEAAWFLTNFNVKEDGAKTVEDQLDPADDDECLSNATKLMPVLVFCPRGSCV